MLQLTSAAAATLGEACLEQGMPPESSGVRVFGSVDQTGQLALQMTLQEEPEPADEVSDQKGIRVFVAPEVAEPLSDLEVDVAETAEGPRLQLREQGTGA
ncbi:MAG: hypothetical protein GEU81_07095 [Nitriliruptorales bacterium]|nr:hypothetical protein [Nitriliruptorales bacterium]